MNIKLISLIPVCSLNLKPIMSRSRSVKRRSSNLSPEKSSCVKKKPNNPLRCKKNVIHANKSIQNSPKSNQRSCSSDINDERKAPETVSLKPEEKHLRTLSRQSKTLQSENIMIADKLSKNKRTHNELSISVEKDLFDKALALKKSPKRRLRSSIRQSDTIQSKDRNMSVENYLFDKALALKKSPKRRLRSSISQSDTIQSKVRNKANKNMSELKRNKRNSDNTNDKMPLVSIDKRLASSTCQNSGQSENIVADKNISERVKSKRFSCVKIDVSSKTSRASLHSSNRNLRSSIGQNITSKSKDNIVVDKNGTKSKQHNDSSLVENDVLNKTPQTSFKTPDRQLRSSSRQGMASKSKDIIASDKNTSKRRSQRLQELNESLFSASYLPESPTKPVKSSNKTVRTPRSSIITSEQQSKKLGYAQKLKDGKSSSFIRLIAKRPVVQKQYRKPSVKSKKRVRPKSYSENIPVDDLALSLHFLPRKAKSEGYKLPGRNTLKRKRLIMNEMKKIDQDYEDDIYEEKQFGHFMDILPDTSESEISWPMTTPKLGLSTPIVRNKSTPVFKDCFSPATYALSRKVAEECLFKNKKRKSATQVETPGVPEKKKLEFNAVIESASIMQKQVEKLLEEKSDEEDSYFNED